MKATFRNLKIDRKDWGDHELKGTVSYAAPHGSISLNLSESHIEKIFEIVGDALIEVSKEAASGLMCDLIEAKSNPEIGND